MFEQLSSRFSQALKHLRGLSHFTEKTLDPALEDIRLAFLEADVALPVVTSFLSTLKTDLLGQAVDAKLSPEQALLKQVNTRLIELMGPASAPLQFNTQPPAVFLMAGLQGSGKTTSTAKLAAFLKSTKKVMLASTDIYRPAAIDQLRHLATQVGVPFFEATQDQAPVDIAKAALQTAKKQFIDVLIIDTAGRLHIDAHMMDEIKALHRATNPIETLFVVDSMTGQDAALTAKAFHEALPLTGIILSKTDGDARGGAALSVKALTGKPIKFIGTGEKTDALEAFHPDRIASRILGMGDMLTLIEEIESKADKQAQEALTHKLKSGKGFDLEDFKNQLHQMNQLGGMQSLMKKMPGMGGLLSQQALPIQMGEAMMKKSIDIINSMTLAERRQPSLIVGSRKKRIALGSGTELPDVNRVLKQFEQLQKLMKKFLKPGALQSMMRGLGGLGGLR